MRPVVRQCVTYVTWLLTSVIYMSYSHAQPTRLAQFDNRLCSEAARLAIVSTMDSVRRGSSETADVATAGALMAKMDGHRALFQDTLRQVQMLKNGVDSLLTQLRLQSNCSERDNGVDSLLTQLRLQSNCSERDNAVTAARLSGANQQALQRITAAINNISTRIEQLPDDLRISQRSVDNVSQGVANLTAQIREYWESLHNAGARTSADRLLSLSNESLTLLRGLPANLQIIIRDYTNDSRTCLNRMLENATCKTPNCCNAELNQSLLNAPALLTNQTAAILKNQTSSITSLLNLASTLCNSSNRTAALSARIALQSDHLSQKQEQMLALLENMSRTTGTIMDRQSSFETYAVNASVLRPINFDATTLNQTFVQAILKDIDTRLSMRISQSRGLLLSDSVTYLMPKQLTYYDIVNKYLIDTLQMIDWKMEQFNKENSSCQSSVEPPFVGYEDAKRSATTRASTVRPQERRTIAEIQAFSEYLSPAYSGFPHSQFYTGCQDAFRKGVRTSGIYQFSVDGSLPFRAWCDFDASGGWMVMQRRLDGTVDFFKRWTDYEKGFGNLWGEYWLGLEKIHLLTRSTAVLSIYMEAFDGQFAWANYSTFQIGDVNSLYTLTVANYYGSAGDSLSGQSRHKFSTWDRDNDVYDSNCAHTFMGAWWYSSCHGSNLNGRYERGTTTSFATANCWQSYRGYYYGLKVTIMRFRA